MPILNVLLMTGVVFFTIGFLHKLGSQKEYLLRLSLLLLGVITSVLLGSKLATILFVPTLSEQFLSACKLLLPYSQSLVIFVLGSKLLRDTKFMNSSKKTQHHGVNW